MMGARSFITSTGTFGRDEQLHGTLDSSKPQTPDYNRIQPSPYATAGKSSGSGGGVAASNKAPSKSGVGAATGKGGFASGSHSYSPPKTSTGGSKGAGSIMPSKPGKGIGGIRPSGRR